MDTERASFSIGCAVTSADEAGAALDEAFKKADLGQWHSTKKSAKDLYQQGRDALVASLPKKPLGDNEQYSLSLSGHEKREGDEGKNFSFSISVQQLPPELVIEEEGTENGDVASEAGE